MVQKLLCNPDPKKDEILISYIFRLAKENLVTINMITKLIGTANLYKRNKVNLITNFEIIKNISDITGKKNCDIEGLTLTETQIYSLNTIS
jgi:hypothetical protein